MSTVTKEIMNLARKAGYEGEDKKNVVKAIDALADTLAGEDLEQATNVAAAIKKLEPYVGGGGKDDYGKLVTIMVQNTTDVTFESFLDIDKNFEKPLVRVSGTVPTGGTPYTGFDVAGNTPIKFYTYNKNVKNLQEVITFEGKPFEEYTREEGNYGETILYFTVPQTSESTYMNIKFQ